MGSITRLTLLLVVAAMTISPRAACAQKKGGTTPSYATIPLSDAEGVAQDINAYGEMVGTIHSLPGLTSEATCWSFDGQGGVVSIALNSTLEVDELPVAFDSEAMAINDQGLIVGSLGDYAHTHGAGFFGGRPVVWENVLDEPQELPAPYENPSYPDVGETSAVSNLPADFPGLKAVVVGRYARYIDPFDPTQVNTAGGRAQTYVVAWGITTSDQITAALVLGVADGTTGADEFASNAVGVNGQLTVVGFLNWQAMRWQLGWDGTQLTLDSDSTLPLFPDLDWSAPEAINADGDICGYLAPNSEPFLIDDIGGALVDQTLARLAKQRSGVAKALNDLPVPQVVGRVLVSGHETPVLWQGSKVVNLEKATPSPTMEITAALGISDAGWIVGAGWDGTRHRPVVLTPQ